MKNKTVPAFIQKAWEILESEEFSDILCWAEDGLSFLVLSEEKLCEFVLPKYFRHSNFSSFVRQLNMYNFHKKRTHNYRLEFYHRFFQRNCKELLIAIRRKPSEAEINYGEQLMQQLRLQNEMESPCTDTPNQEDNSDHIKRSLEEQLQNSSKGSKSQTTHSSPIYNPPREEPLEMSFQLPTQMPCHESLMMACSSFFPSQPAHMMAPRPLYDFPMGFFNSEYSPYCMFPCQQQQQQPRKIIKNIIIRSSVCSEDTAEG